MLTRRNLLRAGITTGLGLLVSEWLERSALAEDVSANGDWSNVRVWYAPQHSLGLRTNPTFGFIYRDAPAAAVPADDFASAIAAAIPAGTD